MIWITYFYSGETFFLVFLMRMKHGLLVLELLSVHSSMNCRIVKLYFPYIACVT
jgi:hypothetical protein